MPSRRNAVNKKKLPSTKMPLTHSELKKCLTLIPSSFFLKFVGPVVKGLIDILAYSKKSCKFYVHACQPILQLLLRLLKQRSATSSPFLATLLIHYFHLLPSNAAISAHVTLALLFLPSAKQRCYSCFLPSNALIRGNVVIITEYGMCS